MQVGPLPVATPAAEAVTFTVDVENHRPDIAPRYPAMTRRIMDFLEARHIRATFFIEGGVLEQTPKLVREIASRGHEIGSHGYRHVPLTCETPRALEAGLARARDQLEQLAGEPVRGFRAPIFSLTPRSTWAVDTIKDVGFTYSSSVLPGRGLSFSHPGAPTHPFLWPNLLLEIPCPVARVGPLSLAVLGGMYLRYLPPWRYRWLSARLDAQVRWTYCHPFDVDLEEPFGLVPGYGLLASLSLWCNRRILLRRWEKLAANPAPPFRDRLPELRQLARPLSDRANAERGLG
jgi:peptidoglycan-N-acetylglucosamine deacetylase